MPIGIDGKHISQQMIDAYKMPQPLLGQVVKFWREGVRGRSPVAAWVTTVAPRAIGLRTTNGTGSTECRHADDPKLSWENSIRENGCWDFTDDYYVQKKTTEDIQGRLEKLEDLVAKLTVQASRSEQPVRTRSAEPKPVAVETAEVADDGEEEVLPARTGFAQMATLRKEAAMLGIKVTPGVTLNQLKEMVENVKAGNAIASTQ